MTGDKETHKFELEGENVMVNVDPNVKVGAKVELIEEKGDNQTRKITVAPHS